MNDNDYSTYNDSELIMMINESNEDAKEILLNKYHYIIGLILKKYQKTAALLGIEGKDLYQEALLGFTDAINRYDEDKDASLPTFISLCVERRIRVIIRKNNNLKSKIVNDTVSLDALKEDTTKELEDRKDVDPLESITDLEEANELDTKILDLLSSREQEVYKLLVKGFDIKEISNKLDKSYKQIDNTIQRIKEKIRKIM